MNLDDRAIPMHQPEGWNSFSEHQRRIWTEATERYWAKVRERDATRAEAARRGR